MNAKQSYFTNNECRYESFTERLTSSSQRVPRGNTAKARDGEERNQNCLMGILSNKPVCWLMMRPPLALPLRVDRVQNLHLN